jgi:zinc transporter ZupT
VDKRDYNLPLHVGALFIILFVSFMGCAFPLLASKFPGLRIPARFFFVVRHFGTGVLIATAFVHLLPTAFISLGDPCLGSFWVTDYPAMPGAIALAAVFLVTVIEMVFHPSRHVPPAQIVSSRGGQGCMSNINFVASEAKDKCCSGHATQHPVRDMGPLGGRQSSVAQGLTQLHRSTSGRIQPAHQGNEEVNGQDKAVLSDSAEEDSLEVQTLSPDQKARKDRLQCILLEMGILFHSVFIGMALSVSIGNEFIILLIAIIFHRKQKRLV